MVSKIFLATSTLIGTILGAGIFGIPYVVMKSGFLIGVIHLIIIGIIMALSTLYLGEIALRTKTSHQLPGYAEKYLGKRGKKWMFIIFMFGIYSALIAYLIAEGQSLSHLIFNSSIYSFHFSLLFWLFLSLISYFGIKALEDGEYIGVSIIIVLIVAISFILFSKINPANLAYINIENALVPLGVILFSFLAFSVVPEIRLIMKNKEKSMKKSILYAYFICFIIYLIFTLIVLGFKGLDTPEIATFALGKAFIILGMLTMFTAYLVLSFSSIDTYRYDFYYSRKKAWLYTSLITLFLFIILHLLHIEKFTTIIGIGGAISGGLTAILILIMIKKAKIFGNRKPEYSIPYSSLLTWIMIIFFILGAIVEIVKITKP